jgi:molecular chaperone DnaK
MSSFVDRAVGIDLGTTHSEIALLDPSERELVIYADRFGRKTVPSAVAWDPATERFVVGRAARALRGQKNAPIESVKRKMGQDVRLPIGPHALLPEEVSAKILEELVRCMREELAKQAPAGTEVRITRAVITVPAYFDGPQIDATRRAGELAGLEVLALLQEPTAAALYHQWLHTVSGGASGGAWADGYRLVYDLGGGTFDISVLRAIGGEHRVLAIDGDNYLGGDDFDRRFAERLRLRLVERGYALDLASEARPDDAARRARLVQLAQEAKEALSSSEVVHLSREAYFTDQQGEPVDVDLEVSRTEHEASIVDLVEATLARAELALARATESAGIGIEEIDRVLLVGGSTRVPLVERRVNEALAQRTGSKNAALAHEVDTAVALGAALYAASLGGLSLGDEHVEVHVRSSLVTRTDALRLSFRAVRSPEGAASIAVEGPEGAYLARGPLDGDVVNLTVRPFGEEKSCAVQLVYLDASDAVLHRLPLTVWRVEEGELGQRPGALSRAAVLAKDLSVEVLRAGRRERKVLLARGATLPTEITTELYTGDRTGTVVLRLCSGLLPIQTLALEIPTDVPVGSPVSLSMRVSESMALDVRASAAGRELWSSIEGQRSSATPVREHIESLLSGGERLREGLWGNQRTLFGWNFEPLAAGLREASSNDPDRTRALVAQLEQLLEAAGIGEEGTLSPPWEQFEGTLDAVRRVAFRSEKVLGQDAASWEARLNGLTERGREAQRARDESRWRAVTNEAQALYETLATQAHSVMDVNDPLYVRARWMSTKRHAETVVRRITNLVLSAAPELRTLQANERDRITSQLENECLVPLEGIDPEADPNDVRRRLGAIGAILDRLEESLDRLPSLGLVTDKTR